jgi:hypothetical protein
MESQQSSLISTLTIGKARKKNGHYTCPIYSNKKHNFYVRLNNATIMGIKEVGNTVVVKCKAMLSFMDELTSVLLKVVEINHTEWFNSSIDETFIEEYFTSPIHYDNKNGVVLRLKVKNIEDIEQVCLRNKVDMMCVLKNITFLRQKFYPVFEVQHICMAEGNDIDLIVDEFDCEDIEEEEVVPSFDEVLAMKQEKLGKLHEVAKSLMSIIKSSETKLAAVHDHIVYLDKCNTIASILKCCDEINEEC